MMKCNDFEVTSIIGYERPRGNYISVHDNEVLLRLTNDDPDTFGLWIDCSRHIDANRMRNIGKAIRNSRHLRQLSIIEWNDFIHIIQFHYLFIFLAENQSIEYFSLENIIVDQEDDSEILAPFFQNNRSLNYIRMTNGDYAACIRTLVASLSQCKMSRLAGIDFNNGNIWDEDSVSLIYTLNAIQGLHNLLHLDLGRNLIANGGCKALRSMLKNAKCQLIYLDVFGNHFDDYGLELLCEGFAVCVTLQTLKIGDHKHVSEGGWRHFSSCLTNPMCSLTALILWGNRFEDDDISSSLGNALSRNEMLKYFSYQLNCHTTAGWGEMFRCLQASSSSAISELDLTESNMNDEAALLLFSILANNKTLKKFLLQSAENISSDGWVACFEKLKNSHSAIEILDLGDNTIDDEGATVLTNVLTAHMSTVSLLNLIGNGDIIHGWRTFAGLLTSGSTSKLKLLNVGGTIEDDEILEYIAALAENNTLQELAIEYSNEPRQSANAFANLLCDRSSIASVHSSNHTLSVLKIGDGDGSLSMYSIELPSLLSINKLVDKAEVIRRKLLLYFFSDVDNISREFSAMPVRLLPCVVEWIGRDRFGYSVLFNYCRIDPTLYEMQNDSVPKRRKTSHIDSLP